MGHVNFASDGKPVTHTHDLTHTHMHMCVDVCVRRNMQRRPNEAKETLMAPDPWASGLCMGGIKALGFCNWRDIIRGEGGDGVGEKEWKGGLWGHGSLYVAYLVCFVSFQHCILLVV